MATITRATVLMLAMTIPLLGAPVAAFAQIVQIPSPLPPSEEECETFVFLPTGESIEICGPQPPDVCPPELLDLLERLNIESPCDRVEEP